MTDPLPDPELDELIAAYLDGEATAIERARVQNDPDLVARAEALRAVANLVAAPVVQPDHAVRDAHIAAALDASSTSPVVTAMPRRSGRSESLRVVSIAALVLAIMVAVPVLLLAGGGDNDDAATSAESADDSLAAMDAVATEDAADGAAEMPAAEEGTVRSGDEAEAEVAGDADDAMAGAEEMAASDEATEAFSDDGAEANRLDDATVDAILEGAPRIDLDETSTPRNLRRQVERQLNVGGADAAAPGRPDLEAPFAEAELMCRSALAAEAAAGGPVLAIGSTNFDGAPAEYIVIDGSLSMVVVLDIASCAVLAAT